MNIVKTESIYLSESEAKTFDKMFYILDGLMKNCSDPVHREIARDAKNKFHEIWEMITDVEMEDDCE